MNAEQAPGEVTLFTLFVQMFSFKSFFSRITPADFEELKLFTAGLGLLMNDTVKDVIM